MIATHSANNVAAVVGVGNTDWPEDQRAVRAGARPTDAYGYGAIALQRALADAGIDKSEVDGLITAPYTPVERAAELYGINPRWASVSDAMQSVLTATMAISSGLCEVVALVLGFNQRSAGFKYGGTGTLGAASNLSYVYHEPWGLTSQGALYALMYRRYMELHGTSEADLGQVAVAQRQWAVGNPRAVMRKPITIEDYLASAYVAEPLHIFDYCLINDGGVALIIAEKERAKRISKRPVTIRAIGRADMHDQSTTLKPRLLDFYHPGHTLVSQQVYDAVGIGPHDMDAVQIYDSFSPHIPVALEGFGFCTVGEGCRYIAETGIGPGGRLPVNTSGGHLSESYMQGWNHQIEAVRQVRGDAATQVPNCRNVQYISDVVGKVFSIIYGVD